MLIRKPVEHVFEAIVNPTAARNLRVNERTFMPERFADTSTARFPLIWPAAHMRTSEKSVSVEA
ncbi:hypothetical protein FHU14_004806 [Mesorhizobium sp. RMAD-H1]|nr:hypothetical protein [Mesorhizobium sp. RMAD-H1]